MGAPLEICSKRGVVAVLASGVVISLTALTGGIAPAFAQPDDDSAVTTTIVAPEPEVAAPETEEEASSQEPSVAPVAPQAPAVDSPPQSEAPGPATVVAPDPVPDQQTPVQSPSTALAPPVTAVEPAEPTSEPTTAERAPAPAESTAPKLAPATPADEATPAAPAPDETSVAPTAPSAALVPNSSTSEPSSKAPADESDTEETGTEKKSADESEKPTVSIDQAAKEIETFEPQTLEAPAEDVKLASAAKPVLVEQQPAPAPQQELASFSNEIKTSLKLPGLEFSASSKTNFSVDPPLELISPVRQWRPDWVQYDEYYRPIILNPYRAPVRIVYMYEMAPRIMIIPPLGRMVFEAAQYAAYSFTAALLAPVVAAANVAQTLTNIAVGSFFGGGYYPGAGMPLPPPPPPVLRYDNVPVLVNYDNARYEPFRVRQIVDVGDDRQYGERKVLLDGVTPAWGAWTQTPSGERQFEVHKTQQFPGLAAPAQGPLPGDYRLRLASDEAAAGGLSGRDIFLMVAAGVIGTLGFGAIGLAFFLGRRREQEQVV